jgi:TonB family protein
MPQRQGAVLGAGARAVCVSFGVFASAALLGCGGLHRPLTCPEKGGPPWVELTSTHFTLRSDAGEDDARDVLLELEKSYDAFLELAFRSENPPPGSIDVVVFDRPDDYNEVAPEKSGGIFTYLDLDARPTIVIKGTYAGTVRYTVQHEIAHRFVGYFMPRAPRWLNEGLAEFYETMRFEGDQAIIGEKGHKHFYHPALSMGRYGVNVDALPTVTELLSASGSDFSSGEKMAEFYGGSWLFVSMLINGSADRQRRFWSFVRGLADGSRPEDVWSTSFAGVPDEVLNEELRHYALNVVNGKTYVRQAPFKLGEPPPVTVVQMGDPDVHLLWAKLKLLKGPEGRERASYEIEQALRQSPDSPDAHHWKGVMALREKRYADAQSDFRTALKVTPKEPRYLQGLAVALFNEEKARPPEKRNWDRLIEPLARLGKVAQTPSALNNIAWSFAQMGKTDQGLPFAKRAVDAAPGCWECLDTLALLAAQKGWAREAVDLQRRAISMAPHTRKNDDLVKPLRKYEAMLKAEQEAPKRAAPAPANEAGATPAAPAGEAAARQAAPITDAAPFDGSQMERPKMLSGRDPVYTQEAVAACVEGTMIARCVINTEGAVTNCRVIKTLPHLERVAVDALQSRRYSPVLFKGAPVNVTYVFNIKFVLPQACGAPPPAPEKAK